MFSSSYGTFSIVSLLCLPLFLGCVCCVCVCLVCDRKKPTDTLDTVRYGTRNGNVTENGTRNVTGNGARIENGIRTITGNGNRTIRRVHFEEFDFPVSSIQPITPRVTIPSDSYRRSMFERTNLSTHFLNESQHNLMLSSNAQTRTNNAIPTISRPAFDNLSLQRQTSLPSYDQVIKQPKTQETPPPMYDEIANCELRRIFRSHARISHV